TGRGLVEVVAREDRPAPTGALGRLVDRVTNGGARRYTVLVGDGEGKILGDDGTATFARVAGALTGSAARVLEDAMPSTGARGGLGIAGVGANAAGSHPLLGVVVIGAGAKVLRDGVVRRSQARSDGIGKTVGLLRQALGEGVEIDFEDAYQGYQMVLEGEKPGTVPASRAEFAAAVR